MGFATHTPKTVVSKVLGKTSNQTLIGANEQRRGVSIFNDSSATLYLKLGAIATTDDYSVQVPRLCLYETPYGYSGRIDGIWSAQVGSARITEFI